MPRLIGISLHYGVKKTSLGVVSETTIRDGVRKVIEEELTAELMSDGKGGNIKTLWAIWA